MYKVHVFYPNSPGVHFDLDYYAGKHMSMVRGLLGPNCTGVSVQAGLAGGAPGQPATYIAIGALDIASLDEFGAAMANQMLQQVQAAKLITSGPYTVKQ